MKQRAWFLTDSGVVAVAAALTLVVLVESVFPPWAPYFIIYAVLAIVIPLAWKTYTFGNFCAVLRTHWRFILPALVVAITLNMGFSWLYQGMLNGFGLGDDAFYSLDLALAALAARAGVRFGISTDTAMLVYAAFVLLWAPVGEELFYRGYVQGVLRRSHAFGAAALVSAAFFGLRHATHLFFLWPHVPLAAAASWVVSSFVFGVLMSYLYEKTNSLYPPILVHFAANVIEVLLTV
ncbi:MAG: CPBP family intramembrane glutamic endopeptidase [Chloroflexota bacterium]